MYALHAQYDEALTRVEFTSAPSGRTFTYAFDDDVAPLEGWLESHFEQPIFVRRNSDGGFPDDRVATGPTLISTATLEAVATWFPQFGVASMRDRFRSNIEIDGVPAFWEDRLFGAADATVRFRVGDVRIEGTNPCARCIVPSRDPVTGEPSRTFAKAFAQARAAALPAWSNRARFDHYYRLSVNTRIDSGEAGKTLRVSDPIEILDGVAHGSVAG